MFDKADLRLIHMIPERNPRSIYRHPHHYLCNVEYSPPSSGEGVIQPGASPLVTTTGNCWGDVSTPAKSSIDDPDVPDLFRLLSYHLGTRGNRPPIGMHQLDFDWKSLE